MPRAAKSVKRKGPDPTGRVDILMIRLLERAVQLYGTLPLRSIYGSYKPQIDHALRKHLGGFRIYLQGPPQRLGGSNAR